MKAAMYTPNLRRDLQRLSRLREGEARTLARAGHAEGAYYIAGLSVECALKACIAKKTKQYEFHSRELAQNAHTHDLEKLLALAGLKDPLGRDLKGNPVLAAKWGVVRRWDVESRYATANLPGDDMVKAIGTAGGAGVLKWIRQHW